MMILMSPQPLEVVVLIYLDAFISGEKVIRDKSVSSTLKRD